jgi:hypothetical protein
MLYCNIIFSEFKPFNPYKNIRTRIKTSDVGVEPTTFSLGGRRAIHCAKRTNLEYVTCVFLFVLPFVGTGNFSLHSFAI